MKGCRGQSQPENFLLVAQYADRLTVSHLRKRTLVVWFTVTCTIKEQRWSSNATSWRLGLFSPWRSAGTGSSYSQTILSAYLSVLTEARSDMNVHVSTFSLKNTLVSSPQRSAGGQLPCPHYQFTAGQLLLLEVIQVDSTVQFLNPIPSSE